MRDAEEFWEELLAQIESGQVVPVLGPELLSIESEGQTLQLYQVLAQRLLAKYALTGQMLTADSPPAPADNSIFLRPYHELNDAVCALAARGKRVQDLYRPIHDLLKTLLEALSPSTLAPLRALASIGPLRLFVSTTPDDLFTLALNSERYQGQELTQQIICSKPNNDLSASNSNDYSAVFYQFGLSSTTPCTFAIHDEDTLEFIYKLQMDGALSKPVLFSQLRNQHLLLIGCNFPDWLSRFFIRLSNEKRLADNRIKHEFLVEQISSQSDTLIMFLERFSPDTWIMRYQAKDFALELARRWHEKHPTDANTPSTASSTLNVNPLKSNATLFISYSHTDSDAAKQLHAELLELGAEIAWFDKSDLHAGDDWEQKIKNQIKSCQLFFPLISATTEARDEGFFREEWTLASERARRIQGRKFIIPIAIDVNYNSATTEYQRVPESFLSAQYGHAPAGRMSEALRNELKRLIRELRTQTLS